MSVEADIMEARHRDNNGTYVTDYTMWLPYELQPEQVGYIQLLNVKDATEKQIEDYNSLKKLEGTATANNHTLDLVANGQRKV